jgi:hypothetical protein
VDTQQEQYLLQKIEHLNNVIDSYKREVRDQRNEMAQMKSVIDALCDDEDVLLKLKRLEALQELTRLDQELGLQ